MSSRELAKSMIDQVPDNKLLYLIAYMQGLSVPDEAADEDDPFYSPENMARLEKAAERMEMSGGTVHELIEDNDHD